MADHPETAPWGTLPGDKDDPNYGRECIRCKGAIRAGLRYAHTCPQHPETVSLRLAEAATPGPWAVYDAGPRVYPSAAVNPWRRWMVHVPLTAAPSYPGHITKRWVAYIERGDDNNADASHIAHAHPGRVRAWLGCVGRLRERVAEGHAPSCGARIERGRGKFYACTCGHEADVAALGAVDAEG